MFSYPPYGKKDGGSEAETAWGDLVYLLLVFCAALLFRLLFLGKDSLFVDEGVSLFFAQQPLKALLPALKEMHEVHPPLYFYFLHFWQFFGKSEFMLRLSSVLFSCLGAALTYLLGKELFSRRAALLSAGLLCFSAFAAFYGRELRMYPLLGFLWLASFYCFYLYLKTGGRGYLLGFMLACLFSLYTHYLSFFLLLSQGVYLLLAKAEPKKIKSLLFACLLLFLLFLPQLLFFLSQGGDSIQDFSLRPQQSFNSLAAGFAKLSFGFHLPFGFETFLLLFWFFCFPLFLAAYFSLKEQIRSLLFCFLLIPLGGAFLVSQITPLNIFELKYFYPLLPALFLIYGGVFSALKLKSVKVLLVGFLIFLNLFSWSNAVFNPDYRGQDFRLAGSFLTRYSGEQDAILVQPSMNQLAFMYYYGGKAKVLGWDELEAQKLKAALSPFKQVFFLTSPYHPLVQKVGLENWLDRNFKRERDFETRVIFPENRLRIVIYKKLSL